MMKNRRVLLPSPPPPPANKLNLGLVPGAITSFSKQNFKKNCLNFKMCFPTTASSVPGGQMFSLSPAYITILNDNLTNHWRYDQGRGIWGACQEAKRDQVRLHVVVCTDPDGKWEGQVGRSSGFYLLGRAGLKGLKGSKSVTNCQ